MKDILPQNWWCIINQHVLKNLSSGKLMQPCRFVIFYWTSSSMKMLNFKIPESKWWYVRKLGFILQFKFLTLSSFSFSLSLSLPLSSWSPRRIDRTLLSHSSSPRPNSWGPSPAATSSFEITLYRQSIFANKIIRIITSQFTGEVTSVSL